MFDHFHLFSAPFLQVRRVLGGVMASELVGRAALVLLSLVCVNRADQLGQLWLSIIT